MLCIEGEFDLMAVCGFMLAQVCTSFLPAALSIQTGQLSFPFGPSPRGCPSSQVPRLSSCAAFCHIQ